MNRFTRRSFLASVASVPALAVAPRAAFSGVQPQAAAAPFHALGLSQMTLTVSDRQALARFLPGAVRHADPGAPGEQRLPADWRRAEVPGAEAGCGGRTSQHQRPRFRRREVRRDVGAQDALGAWRDAGRRVSHQARTDAIAGDHAQGRSRWLARTARAISSSAIRAASSFSCTTRLTAAGPARSATPAARSRRRQRRG